MINILKEGICKNIENGIIPVWEKTLLTLKEAAEYSGIGINRLREITGSDRCDFVLWVGNHRHIKRKKFEEYLERSYSI